LDGALLPAFSALPGDRGLLPLAYFIACANLSIFLEKSGAGRNKSKPVMIFKIYMDE
jgi:hypothetical protein